jgi:hypothetical protein
MIFDGFHFSTNFFFLTRHKCLTIGVNYAQGDYQILTIVSIDLNCYKYLTSRYYSTIYYILFSTNCCQIAAIAQFHMAEFEQTAIFCDMQF